MQQQERRLAAAAGGASKAGKRPPRTTSQRLYVPPAGAGAAGAAAPLTAEELAARERNNWVMAGAMLALSGYGYYVTVWQRPSASGAPPPQEAQLVNWSGTHECATRRLYQPESLAELEAVVAAAQKTGARGRESALCCGGAGSPEAAVCCPAEPLGGSAGRVGAVCWNIPSSALAHVCARLGHRRRCRRPQAASCGAWAAGCRPTGWPSARRAWSAWHSWTGF